jgi:2-desacetyl-2-hydroxyethyl bacteriochlorophyllide A dehydrogenase
MTTRPPRAFWIREPCHGELRNVEIAAPGPDEVEVETLYSAISRGTESLVFSGKVPPSQFERMRAPFQEGSFPAPVKYGYINVGQVVRGNEAWLGRHVFCLYPHQTRYVVPVAALTVIPDSVPTGRAVLAANLETAVNGIWDAAPRAGDRVAVVGAGAVGCLVAWLAAGQRGTEVELIDIDLRKRSAASALGVVFREPVQAARDADIVIEASGTDSGLRLALELGAFEARIVSMSWFGMDAVPLPLGEAFHSKRLKLISSQVAHIAASQRARWDYSRRMRLVMRLLESPELDALITGESTFDELPAVMQELAGGTTGSLCHRISYR